MSRYLPENQPVLLRAFFAGQTAGDNISEYEAQEGDKNAAPVLNAITAGATGAVIDTGGRGLVATNTTQVLPLPDITLTGDYMTFVVLLDPGETNVNNRSYGLFFGAGSGVMAGTAGTACTYLGFGGATYSGVAGGTNAAPVYLFVVVDMSDPDNITATPWINGASPGVFAMPLVNVGDEVSVAWFLPSDTDGAGGPAITELYIGYGKSAFKNNWRLPGLGNDGTIFRPTGFNDVGSGRNFALGTTSQFMPDVWPDHLQNFIIPNMQACVDAGANTYRFWGTTPDMCIDRPDLSRGPIFTMQYLANCLLEICYQASLLGLYVEMTAHCSFPGAEDTLVTGQVLNMSIPDLAGWLSGVSDPGDPNDGFPGIVKILQDEAPNCVYVDLINEGANVRVGKDPGGDLLSTSDIETLLGNAKSVAPNIPITVSYSDAPLNGAGIVLYDGADFVQLHIYQETDIADYIAQPEREDRAVLVIGEYGGRHETFSPAHAAAPYRTTLPVVMDALVEKVGCGGVILWQIMDQNTDPTQGAVSPADFMFLGYNKLINSDGDFEPVGDFTAPLGSSDPTAPLMDDPDSEGGLEAGELTGPTGAGTRSLTGFTASEPMGGVPPYTYFKESKRTIETIYTDKGVSGLTFDLSGLLPDTEYQIRLRQEDSVSDIVYTNVVNGTTEASEPFGSTGDDMGFPALIAGVEPVVFDQDIPAYNSTMGIRIRAAGTVVFMQLNGIQDSVTVTEAMDYPTQVKRIYSAGTTDLTEDDLGIIMSSGHI